MLLQVTNISHLNKWVSLKFKVHHQLMLGDHQFMKLEKKDNKLENQSLIGTLTVMELDLRKKTSPKTLLDKLLPQSNSIEIPLISQESMLVIRTRLHHLHNTSMVIKLELLSPLLSFKLMVLQLLKDNMPGENQYTQQEVLDNHSQTLVLLKEQVPQFLSNGPMETGSVQRKKISLRISKETLTVILISSTKTLLISQVLLHTQVTIPNQLVTTMVDQNSWETEFIVN